MNAPTPDPEWEQAREEGAHLGPVTLALLGGAFLALVLFLDAPAAIRRKLRRRKG